MLVFLLTTVLLLWALTGALYRLFFSPIAAIPGPTLAAITQWYETYYDVCLNGKFTLHLEKLHAKYGPIVRINPWEVHINDPEYFETIYSTAAFNRVPQHVSWSNIPNCLVFTVSHNLHRIRRSAMNPFFSKRQVSFHRTNHLYCFFVTTSQLHYSQHIHMLILYSGLRIRQ
jgi:hypothetical protein